MLHYKYANGLFYANLKSTLIVDISNIKIYIKY